MCGWMIDMLYIDVWLDDRYAIYIDVWLDDRYAIYRCVAG